MKNPLLVDLLRDVSSFSVAGHDFYKGKRLARWDHIVEWDKPKQCPKGRIKKDFIKKIMRKVFIMSKPKLTIDKSSEGVAIIGMSGRFPGARTIDEFWQNLRNGVELY